MKRLNERPHSDTRASWSGVQDAAFGRASEALSSGHPAELLLAALGKDRFTSQTFPDHAGATRRATIRHGPWHAQRRHLEDDNRHGMGCFFMVNDGDLRGRRAENVRRIAAYFADFDGAELPTRWPWPPTAVIESSPDRHHVYWRVRNAPIEVFSHVQKHLAMVFGSDPKVSDLPRVMRLPGMVHAKGEPFVSRLILVEPTNIVEHEDFVDAFAVPPMTREGRDITPAPAAGRRLRRYVWSAVQGEHDRVAAAPKGTRNTTLHEAAVRLGSLVGAGALTDVDARDALLAGTQAAGDPLPVGEAERAIESGLLYGQRHPRDLKEP